MTFILTALVVTAQAADDISLLQTLSTHHADKVAHRGDRKNYALPSLLDRGKDDKDDTDGKKGKDDKDDKDGKKGKDDKDDKDGKKGKDEDKKDKDKDKKDKDKDNKDKDKDNKWYNDKDKKDKDKDKDHDDHNDKDEKDGKKGKDDHDDHDDKDDKDGKKGKDYKDFYQREWYKDWYKDRDDKDMGNKDYVDEPDHPTRPPDHPTRPPSHPTRPPVAAAAARAGPSQPESPECVFEAYSKSEGKWFRLERLRATRECTGGRAEEIKGYDSCIYDLQEDQLRDARFVRTDGMCERTILKQACEEEEGPEEKGKGKKGKKKKLEDKDLIMKKVESRYLPIGIGHRVCQIVIVPSKAKKDKKDKK